MPRPGTLELITLQYTLGGTGSTEQVTALNDEAVEVQIKSVSTNGNLMWFGPATLTVANGMELGIGEAANFHNSVAGSITKPFLISDLFVNGTAGDVVAVSYLIPVA